MRNEFWLDRSRLKALILAAAAIILAAVFAATAGYATELTVAEIIERLDSNEYMDSVHSVSRMVIQSGRREMVKEMESWGVGKEKALVTFLNPSDRGTKYLKLNDELWMFFPDAEDLVKISGHMLRQGMMGSDFSYQDALESEKMAELYDFKLVGREVYNGIDCYVLEGNAKPGKTVSYPIRKMWIDSQKFVGVKEELYAASGKLLKVSRVEEFLQQDGRVFPKRLVMEDKLKKNSSTTLVIEKIEFDVEIPDEIFSLRNLMR